MPRKWQTVLKVCGSVLAVLFIISILFPCNCKDRGKVRQISCLSQEKQIGLAIFQYTDDYDGKMPPIVNASNPQLTWRASIYPQLKNYEIYRCPDHDNKTPGTDGFFRSYAMNASAPRSNTLYSSDPVSENTDPNIATTILLCEVSDIPGAVFNIDDPVNFGPTKHILWAGHTKGSDYLFADGHVRWYRPLATQSFWHLNKKIPLSANGIAILQETERSVHPWWEF